LFQFRVVALLLVASVAALGWVLTYGAWQLEQEVALVGPLDARKFARLTVITAGTGGAYENPERRGPAIAVGLGDRTVLVDAGRGVAEALRLAKLPVAQPSALYLTSLSPENVVGLDDLLLTGWVRGRSEPLRVVGPAGTDSLVRALLDAHRAGISATRGGLGVGDGEPRVNVEEISDAWEEVVDGLSVRAAAQPGGPLPAYAYRFEGGGRSAVISGAGWATDVVVELAKGSDLLVHEAVYVPSEQQAQEIGYEVSAEQLARANAQHTGIDQVGTLASDAGVRSLVLVRMRPPPLFDVQISSIVNDVFDGRIAIAADGDEFEP
jgi:ribonuclease BN (tRNA processing enzyme)